MFSAIYLDLDDVLVNFDRAVCDLFDWDYTETMRERLGSWCFSTWGHGKSTEELRQRIDVEGIAFWRDLDTHPWLDELINLCFMYTKNVTIVTNPGPFKWSVQGKHEWFREKVHNKYPVGIEMEANKERFADPTTLLIDDREDTISKFTAAGGKAMLFPSYGNRYFTLRSEFHANGTLVEEWFRYAIPVSKC